MTPRFVVRTLKREDVSARYVGWFDDPVARRFISWRFHEDPYRELCEFVEHHDERDDSLLLGIFANETQHVANLKYEPIDTQHRTAVLGVLVGETAWRGRGLFAEVFAVTAAFLRRSLDVGTVTLGVHRENSAAIAAYSGAGFVEVRRTGSNGILMECNIDGVGEEHPS